MTVDTRTRCVITAVPMTLAWYPSYLLLADFHRVVSHTDAQLIASFAGAAQEDILGFGFWPAWIGLALLETILVGWQWAIASTRWSRLFSAGTLGVFGMSTLLDYCAYSHEYALWCGHFASA